MQVGNVTVTQLFRQECEMPGDVRSVHAIEALQRSDTAVKYQLGEMTVLLAIKRITLPAHPYTLLLIAASGHGNTEIYLGFRLYDDVLAAAKGTEPLDLFSAFLERYGVPVKVGSLEGLFIPRAVVNVPPEGGQLVGGLAQQGEPQLVHAFVKILDTSPRTAEVAWAFSILTGRYRKDIQGRRR
jgi:hypothetical protein